MYLVLVFLSFLGSCLAGLFGSAGVKYVKLFTNQMYN